MNTEEREPTQTDVEQVQLGTRLRLAREELGLTLQQVADSLRLRFVVLEEIENNQFEQEQIATFTRGYIRAYAKLVGLNGEALLQEYTDFSPVNQDVKMQSFSSKVRKAKNDNRLMTLTWAILTIACGITITWWWQAKQTDELASGLVNNNADVQVVAPITSQINAEIAEPTAVALALPAPISANTQSADKAVAVINQPQSNAPAIATMALNAPKASRNAPSPPPITAANVSSNNNNQQPAPISALQPQALAAKPQPKPAASTVKKARSVIPLITMTFVADCWVDIRDASGKRLLTGIKSRGEEIELAGKAPFKVVLGAPAAVELAYNGKQIDLSGYPPKRVARISLPLQ